MAEPNISDHKRRMVGALEVFKSELVGLRAGRASAALLEPVVVEAYAQPMPINQVATVSVPDARMVTVQVWDQGLAPAVEKAICDAGLGLNPQREGVLIRVPIPQLTEDRRKELTKIAQKYAEQAKIAVRNIRRDGMDGLKRLEKESQISKDEQRAWETDLQSLTDEHVSKIDEYLEAKKQEIMQV